MAWTKTKVDLVLATAAEVLQKLSGYAVLAILARRFDKTSEQRSFGPRGHLDNMDAGALLARLGADGRRRTAWLAHLSAQANSPRIALDVVGGVLALAEVRCITLHALPRRAPLTWESDRHLEQLQLFAGI